MGTWRLRGGRAAPGLLSGPAPTPLPSCLGLGPPPHCLPCVGSSPMRTSTDRTHQGAAAPVQTGAPMELGGRAGRDSAGDPEERPGPPASLPLVLSVLGPGPPPEAPSSPQAAASEEELGYACGPEPMATATLGHRRNSLRAEATGCRRRRGRVASPTLAGSAPGAAWLAKPESAWNRGPSIHSHPTWTLFRVQRKGRSPGTLSHHLFQ